MPEVYVYALEGPTTEQKSALMKDITDAVVRNFAVDPEAVVLSIVETPKTDKAKGGIPFSERQDLSAIAPAPSRVRVHPARCRHRS